jgi:hypothetical protein
LRVILAARRGGQERQKYRLKKHRAFRAIVHPHPKKLCLFRLRSRSTQTAILYRGAFSKQSPNRVLNTDALLELLSSETPNLFDIAEVVGKWVWVQFADIPAAELRRQLAELGFHWNNARQSWQHPCGQFRDKRAPMDPRQKYGSYFAADRKAA